MANFNRFIHFGTIADQKTREQLARSVFEQLQKSENMHVGSNNAGVGNFATAIDEVLDNATMKELCSENSELAENITSEILDFINKTKKHIDKSENPFAPESDLLASFVQTERNSFDKNWKSLYPFIDKTYQKNQIDTEFYTKEFQKSLQPNDKKTLNFESVKEHFTDTWSELLDKKQTDWELSIIDEQRKKFCEGLYKRIEDVKKLQDLLSPFTNELGRLWDMSNGGWHKVNFDILQKYADLLQQDKALQELAEMLGRMHQAEKEFEEELFADIQLKTVWKVEAASKSDLIGVCESDDISNALPSEFALLADPTTESVFYKKFAEKKLQTFEYRGRTQEIIEETFENKHQKANEGKKGPFIICVDTSGSMHGTPETVAKMLCFAILKIAIRENRKCYLISFSTSIETLDLTDLKNSLDKIIQFLSMSFYGGTDASPAMQESLRVLETNDYKKADVLMISDFVMPAFTEITQKRIQKAKENGTKFHSLVIGESQNNAVIHDFDNNWLYITNNKNGIMDVVKQIRSTW
jgi:uncharacterized protein with von Willebrand factor type A (vWA) domain